MNRILSIEKIDRFGRVVETIAESGSEHSEGAALMEPSLPDSTSDTGRSRRRGGTRRVRVPPEEGEAFVISGRRASGMGLKPGDELTEEAYAEIIQSLRSACMQRCGTLLGSRDYPVHRLRTKLQEAGYPTSIIEDCIEKLQKAHYLDDARYAQTYLRSHLADRSLLRIRHDLMERGVPEDLIERAVAEISEETDPEEVQLDQIRRLLRKRGYDPAGADYTVRQKTMAFLQRKGYDMGLIRRAMEKDEWNF